MIPIKKRRAYGIVWDYGDEERSLITGFRHGPEMTKRIEEFMKHGLYCPKKHYKVSKSQAIRLMVEEFLDRWENGKDKEGS